MPSLPIYSLEFTTINSEDDIKKYYDILNKFENYCTFYSLEYCNYQENHKLNYFVLKKNQDVKVVMPIFLNKIDSLKDKSYYDASSPYGYSGPLTNKTTPEDLDFFWIKVDEWYKSNNVVTEFIRFNLEGNHVNYSGHLIPTLSNVKGKLIAFEELWLNFKQKVRNNYRKAEKRNLRCIIYDSGITPQVIDQFYNIYIKTMERNAATKNYFYPRSYFENLIDNNADNILISIVYKDETPISAELIIINGDIMYSYLGGTQAEYFNARPNDFLKIEVIKWGLKNNMKYYILGGGRKNNDGLYQYKKSFFSKDEDVYFFTGRKIINEKVYNLLIREIDVNYTDVNTLLSDSNNFFPIYKKSNNVTITAPSKTDIVLITERSEWQKALQSVSNFDFYHTYDYHNLSIKKDEKAILIKYTENDSCILLPLVIRQIENSDFFDATSVYGYSGPIQKNISNNFDNESFIKSLNDFFNRQKIVSVFSRLNPFIDRQSQILNGLGDIVELGNVVNIDLTIPIDEQRMIFSKTTKRYLNKGRKVIDIVKSDSKEDIDTFIELYYENMDRVNAKKSYYFPKEYFYKFIQSEEFKTDVLFAKDKETSEIISAAMMVKVNNIIQYHISGTKTDFLNISPIRLLIDEMRINGSNENYTYFNLGGGLGNEDDELFRFKSSFSKDYKIFKVWKYIVNNNVYDELVAKNKVEDIGSSFFPLYRLKGN
ncbi:GNAT family N-acetyltransferase [Hyunsoonleella ulvae]|uniref:GNAT family N-acetyltransferase n=1 Tax=Hyunsoonleella ulvae TaxID=2799948 RepID=UPI001939303B|nr:GNAT family N-acetyltransferase [Hyunsoonleella ulvae]